ncbi:MAG TPA: magnesium-translocating P-type ATPase [Burkholderiaceae bacterium]|nr:magnesium-translocating P-type ATPase [Burkholderiaceae bacterium]
MVLDFSIVDFLRNVFGLRTPEPEQAAARRSFAHLVEIGQLTPEAALARLESTDEGLIERESAERLERYGPNEVAHERKKHPLRRLLELFANPLPLLLLVLALVADLTGEVRGAIVITLMVVLSVLLAFVQEYRSSRAAEKLRAMVHTTVTVLRRDLRKGIPDEVSRHFPVRLQYREPERAEIPLAHLVPGDVVVLSAGDMIPADVRLISAKDLFVSQATLTGESLPVEKFAAAAPGTAAPLDLPNIAFMGSNVVSGTARAAVVSTGGETYFGSVAGALVRPRQLTSFDVGVNRFIWLMIRFMAVMVPLVFLINGVSKGNWVEAFLFAVAVAVGLAPEMLPMIVTINLGKGALAMARKRVIVKRLSSIQNFGAMDVLCTDKTGTLTQDKVILERHVDIFGHDSDRVLQFAYLNSYHQSGLKNLLDVAVLEHVEVHEALEVQQHYAKTDEVPFDFQRRRMSVIVEKDHASHILICKGAVEEVFAACGAVERDGVAVPIETGHLEELQPVIKELNEDGFRVIAVAYKEVPARPEPYSVADERDLVLLGYIAFLDPPKDTAAAALQALARHGVQVKVLTGDNDVVTRKVCRDVGLDVTQLMLGADLESLSDAELDERVDDITVFAKLTPQQKARVIGSLHRNGRVVGFLGDGINDGPALKAADVGISVDTAVDIAKESADIILMEKSLLVLEAGVLEGRGVFGNITKYIKMSASSNFGNMFSVLGASAFLPFLPMAPVQILLNNLMYDFSQTAVATDNVDAEYVEQPRRWDIGNIGRFMLFIGPLSSIFDYATFFTMLYVFDAWSDAPLFQTAWFVESLLSQTLVVHVLRTGGWPFVHSRPSLLLGVATLAICAVGLWLPTSPLADALGFVALPHGYWAALALILVGYLLLTQTVKVWLIRRFGLG